MKKKALDEATLQVGSYLLLGRETMHLFGYLTRAAPEPFCTEEVHIPAESNSAPINANNFLLHIYLATW